MARFGSLRDAFSRMSDREKKLVIGLVAVIGGLAVVGGIYAISALVGDDEEQVAEARSALSEIRLLADEYKDRRGQQKAIQDLVRKNPITSLVTTVNEIARGIKVESEDPRFAGTGKTVADIITSFSGKTVETKIEPILKKKRRTRKEDEKDPSGNYEIEQTLDIAEIPIDTLYKFLEAIEASDDLLFVRKLDINRKFGNLENAQATITVSTLRYKEKEAAP